MADKVQLVSKIVIHGRIEDVWREITKTNEPQLAFFGAQMHRLSLGKGSVIQMRTPDNEYTSVVGEVLEATAPHKFSHTMKFTGYEDPYCKVTYLLKEIPEGVEFTLISEDVPAGTKTEKSMRQGGEFIVKTLKQVIEDGKPSFGTRAIYAMFGLLGPLMTPAKSKSANWPLEGSARG